MPTLHADSDAPWSLAARHVSYRYDGVTALDDISFALDAGSALALVGESGAGKSTLLRCFSRLVEPTGDIDVGGVAIRTLEPLTLRRRIGYVPQDGGLLPHWPVLRNAALVPTLLGSPTAHDSAEQALALVGLPVREFGNRFPHELSGGQRQRVAMARAVAGAPRLLLLDEPFGALDAIARGELQDVLAAVRAELEITMVLVTHDLAEAARLADFIAVMRAGRVEQYADVSTIVHRPATPYVERLLRRAQASARSLAP